MTGMRTLAIVALALACVGGLWLAARRDGAEPVAALPATRAAATPSPTSEPARIADVAPLATRAAIAQPDPAPANVLPSSQAPARVVRGRVLDLDRRPVAGLEIGRFDRPSETFGVRSAGDGAFEIELTDTGSALEARGPGWATLWADRHDGAAAGAVVTILVAPSGRLGGVVVDRDGQPVAGARVAVGPDAGVLRALSDLLTPDPQRLEYAATSDEHGRFDLGDVPLAPGTIRATRGSEKSAAIATPAHARGDLELRIDGVAGREVVVRGRVVDARGEAVERAFVGLGGSFARTANDGGFELRVRTDAIDDERRNDLVAVGDGALPARIAIGARADVERADGRFFELALGGAPLAIRGRVVDSDGNPLDGVDVSVVEEDLGRPHDAPRPDPMRPSFDGRSVERVLRGEADEVHVSGFRFSFGPPRSAENGSFELHGLQDKTYDVRASSRARMARRVVPDVAAGTHDLVIELDTRGPTQLVAGTVVDGAGRALADVDVSVTARVPGDSETFGAPGRRTGPDGAFRFDPVRGTVTQVVARLGERETYFEPAPADALDDVRLVLRDLRAIQVDLTANPALATELEVHDARSRRARLYLGISAAARDGGFGGRSASFRRPIRDGRSDVLTVSEGDLTAVLFRGDAEVARVPIVLAREGLTVVRP